MAVARLRVKAIYPGLGGLSSAHRGVGAGCSGSACSFAAYSGMETEQHVGDLLRVGCRPEDFALVFFQRLDPMGDVTGKLRDVGRNAEMSGDESGGEFRAQFLHRMAGRTEMRLHVTVETGLVAGPVTELI